MKCIKCGTDNYLREIKANQGRCKQCNHPFAFEPTGMDDSNMNDSMFAKILADISANDTLYFNRKQLLYSLDNYMGRKSFEVTGFIAYYMVFYILYCFSILPFF